VHRREHLSKFDAVLEIVRGEARPLTTPRDYLARVGLGDGGDVA
jgi:hypothetical protein